nr:hypothetical protein FVER53263_10131 [Fusarium verticillioides]
MPLYSDAPDARQFYEDKPTLLVSWWITVFCVAIILTRMSGRYVRVEKLLKEDKIAAGALIPLVLRAICVHFVLKNGTNNVNLDGLKLSDADIDKRIVGSKMVLASRVFYASILWILKLTTLEFFERLAGATRRRSHRIMIHAMRATLAATFLAVVISDLAECQPFPHYWQVTPDPGPQCRQAFVQMLTMGACNAFTDLVLIAFPIPIILSTQIATKRKVLLIMLFSFGLLTVGITLYRIPRIIEAHGSQVVRTMWASIEILAATAVGNIVALGSFLRDSGVKRKKFKESNSYSGYSNSRSQSQPTKLTRTAHSQWEDEDHVHPRDAQTMQSFNVEMGSSWSIRAHKPRSSWLHSFRRADPLPGYHPSDAPERYYDLRAANAKTANTALARELKGRHLQMIAFGGAIGYWNPDLTKSIFVAIFLSAIVIINLFGVKTYGEAEFIFSLIKITAIVGFILLAIVINVGGEPESGYIGGMYWRNPGPFNNGFKGFCSVLVTSAFSFTGTELIGLAAAETANPRKSLPTAIKQVFWRITIFYIIALLLVGLLVPSDDKRLVGGDNVADATASPCQFPRFHL